MESQEMTSPFNAFAAATASAVLPLAVGPTMQRIRLEDVFFILMSFFYRKHKI
jgi:hypothetical protein